LIRCSSSQTAFATIDGDIPRFNELDFTEDGGGKGPHFIVFARVSPRSNDLVFACPRFFAKASPSDSLLVASGWLSSDFLQKDGFE
jgi:hypothetical protein